MGGNAAGRPGRRLDAAEIDVVEPRTELAYAFANDVGVVHAMNAVPVEQPEQARCRART